MIEANQRQPTTVCLCTRMKLSELEGGDGGCLARDAARPTQMCVPKALCIGDGVGAWALVWPPGHGALQLLANFMELPYFQTEKKKVLKKLINSPVADFGYWLHRLLSLPPDTPWALTAFPRTLRGQKE